MAIKVLQKPIQSKKIENKVDKLEEKVQKFIIQGGSLSGNLEQESSDDHRLTLRIPKRLLDKVDVKRKQRVGTISRNLWILEVIEKATQKL